MSKLSERQRLLLTIVVGVLAAGGLVAMILSDRSEIDAAQEEIVQLDDRVRAADAEIARTKEREEKVIVFRAVEDRELAVLPTKQKIAEFQTNLSAFLASAGVRFREMPESTAVESDLAKGIFVTRTTVACEGDAASMLKLVNMLENDPRLVSVKGLAVEAGERDPRKPDEPVVHEVELTLETYFYNPESGATEQVPIPGAERRLEEEAIQEAIVAFQPERPDTYVLRPAASRRDAFVDPRAIRTREDPERVAALHAEQEPIVIDLETKVRDADEKLQQAHEHQGLGDLFRKERLLVLVDEAMNEVAARLGQVEQLKLVTLPDLQDRLKEVKRRVDTVRTERGPQETVVTAAVAEATLADANAIFTKGEFAEVVTFVDQWYQYLRGKQVEPAAVPVREEIARLRDRATRLADLRARTLTVTGTIVHKADPSRSLCVVNGKTLLVGDPVDDDGKILVGQVLDDGVEFHYEGEAMFVKRQGGGEPERGVRGLRGPRHPAAPPRRTGR